MTTESLRASARAGLVWGVFFTLGRDAIQFLSMLALVRILSPEIYGQFALAQSILILLSMISLKTFAPFALQSRNPREFDWDVQYSVGLVINTTVFAATLLVAAGLYIWGSPALQTIAAALAVLSLTFPAEIIGTFYFTRLQAEHDWRRMRTLLLQGALLSSVCAILLAMAGAGIFSLVFGSILLTLPLSIDFFRQPEKPRFRRDWYCRYGEGFRFGFNRSTAGALTAGSTLAEQSVLSAIFGFSTLGVYTRAIGLAQITSGRIGPVVMQMLYPVLTRAEVKSERFRRFAALLCQGVMWTSFPAAAFLALEGERLVGLLYGDKWGGVVPLIAAAAALLALRGLHQTLNSILLANQQPALCLHLDFVGTASSLAVLAAAVFFGPQIYLYALSAHALVIVGLTALWGNKGGAIAAADVIRLGAACLLAVTAGALVHTLAMQALEPMFAGWPVLPILAITVMLFSLTYVITLRLISPTSFFSLLEALPLPHRIRAAVAFLRLAPGASR